MANVKFHFKMLRLRFCGSASKACGCTIFYLTNIVSENMSSGSLHCNNYVFVFRFCMYLDWLCLLCGVSTHSRTGSELALLPRSKQKGMLIPSILL
jgi:hypothetical protein